MIEPTFEKAGPFHHGLAAVMLGGKWGYVDRAGRLAIEARFLNAGPFFDGMFACVEIERNRPLHVDRKGAFAFQDRRPGCDGVFAARLEGTQAWDSKWGFRDCTTGEWVIEPRFAEVSDFFGEYATAMKWTDGVGGRHGMIDRQGRWVIEPRYTLGHGVEARGGIFVVKEGDTFLTGIVHPTEGVVVPFQEQRLLPDTSRQEPSWPPRTPEDETYSVDKAKVRVSPPTGAAAFPFRFYGVGIGDFETVLQYRVELAEAVDMDKAKTMLRDDLPWASVRSEGQFALVTMEDVVDGPMQLEAEAIEAFRNLHRQHPIVEVVNLVITDAVDSEWQRWSLQEQERPNTGPTFGLEWLW